jgi:hypothetical protein
MRMTILDKEGSVGRPRLAARRALGKMPALTGDLPLVMFRA